ncbi:MAG TPA: aromatic ring-hydroxylating dioxygenase subunit alpha [Dehalococcoidia bacterium]|nr:aromatic ring-hydroxylating dioxygenase subunit alpha [Dehalococcoidia bacterium]
MELKDLVIDDAKQGIFRVHRSTMTSQDILELEQDRIFSRNWLYLGHESELPKPGDFRRRNVGGRPMFFVRDNAGQVRVFFNTCLHRGALVCRQDEGNAEVFECFYHGWMYNNQGKLISVPEPEGYSSDFDREERSLKSPPRVESYRGFYFVSFDPDIEDLATYLADAKEFLDLSTDWAEASGGFQVLHGAYRYTLKANWKLLTENSIDNYHVPTVHQTFLQYVGTLGGRRERTERHGRALGNGHAAFEYQVPIGTWPTPLPGAIRGESEEINRQLTERYGDKRAQRMAGILYNMLIYPNTIFLGGNRVSIRSYWPVAPDLVEVTQWYLAIKGESVDSKEHRLENYLIFQGPGGFATPDDVEALESCQAGFAATNIEWSDISRGMRRDPLDVDELQMRTFWRQWHAQIQGHARADHHDDLLPAQQR